MGAGDPALRASYEQCRRLNAAHGKTYYLATLLLPAAKRPYVHALYGFARYADEFVDSLTSPDPQALLDAGALACASPKEVAERATRARTPCTKASRHFLPPSRNGIGSSRSTSPIVPAWTGERYC